MSEKPDNEIPTYTDVPIAIDATGSRSEFDSLGHVDVPADKYWGAQTQRSLQHFSIGDDRMPIEVYRRLRSGQEGMRDGQRTSRAAGAMAVPKRSSQAADEVIAGKLDDQFPLYVWQTGSGTQTQHERQRGPLQPRHPAARRRARQQAAGAPERPREHGPVVSNDTFPTAMHIAAVTAIDDALIPSVTRAARRDRGEGRRMDGRRQDRPHPPRGCGAADGRPGVVGLRRPTRGASGGRRARAPRPASSSPSAAPPSAPGSTRHRASAPTSHRRSPS